MSVSITATKMSMMLSKVKKLGMNTPFRATSIIPSEETAPAITPIEAMIRIVLNEATFEPIAEFKKFAASLLTPTVRSMIARRNKTNTRISYHIAGNFNGQK